MTAPRPTSRQRTKADRSAGRRAAAGRGMPNLAGPQRTAANRTRPTNRPPPPIAADRQKPTKTGNGRRIRECSGKGGETAHAPATPIVSARPKYSPAVFRTACHDESHRSSADARGATQAPKGGEAEGGKDASQTAKLRTGIGPTRKAGVRIAQGTYPNAAGIHGHFTPTAGGVGSVARKHHAPLHHGADFASARTEGQVMRCTADLACGTPFRSGLAGERPRRHGQRPADSHAGPPIRTESASATANRRFTQARTGSSAEPGTGRNAPSKNGTRRRSEKQTTDTSETRPYDDAL